MPIAFVYNEFTNDGTQDLQGSEGLDTGTALP